MSNNFIIIAISVASSSLNNPVHKLVQEDGHGKLPVLEIYILIIDSFIFKFYFKISKERQKYVFGVFRFNMVGILLTVEKGITKGFLFLAGTCKSNTQKAPARQLRQRML